VRDRAGEVYPTLFDFGRVGVVNADCTNFNSRNASSTCTCPILSYPILSSLPSHHYYSPLNRVLVAPSLTPSTVLVPHPLSPTDQISRAFTNSVRNNMPPVDKPSTERYDYIIIGGGSGGSGSSVRSFARSIALFITHRITYVSFCRLWLAETCGVVWQKGRCDREHWCAWWVLRQSRYVSSVNTVPIKRIVTRSVRAGCVPKKVLFSNFARAHPRDHH
jgi:hypothetical protein